MCVISPRVPSIILVGDLNNTTASAEKLLFIKSLLVYYICLHLHNKTTVKLAIAVFQTDSKWIAIELQLRLTTLLQLMTINIKGN